MSAARSSSIAVLARRLPMPRSHLSLKNRSIPRSQFCLLPPSSPVASSSPEAHEPVPEPDELEGDEETPAKAKKGSKPLSVACVPAPRSPVDEAQQEPTSPHGSPKLTSPVMPASNAPSEHQPSASPPPASLKTPVPSTRPDPRFRIHSDPEPCHPLSPSEMNLLQLGADDLNYWGYVIDVMYRQLFAPLNPVKQVAYYHYRGDVPTAKRFRHCQACQEMDFPETSYIFQLRSAVMRWFQDSNYPQSRLPSNAVEISMGPYLENFDLALLTKPSVPNYGNAHRTVRIKSYHAEDILLWYKSGLNFGSEINPDIGKARVHMVNQPKLPKGNYCGMK
ncbi:hypothetical protein C8J56DRAFT_894317 [Mycena floridula]|nr:hypothetical protein C8J56DRAFT_894317 [Mycena floridula]